MRLRLEVTNIVVVGAVAVVDVRSPSSASPSPPTNQSQSGRVWAAEWSPSCTTRRANRCAGSSFELRVAREFHSHALPLMRMSAGHASSGRMAGERAITSTSSTPLAGLVTCSWALETTRRAAAEQLRARRCVLERRDPSIILPNHPPHAAHAARTPSTSADSHLHVCCVRRLWVAGWWSTDKQHGPRTSSLSVGPGSESWPVLVGMWGCFLAGPERF